MFIRLRLIFYYIFLLKCMASVFTYEQRSHPYSRHPFFNDDEFTHENIHFYGPPTDPFWQQFWDVYNYRGPLQENPFSRPFGRPFFRPLEKPSLRPVERPGTGHYFPHYTDYPGTEHFIPRRETATPVRHVVTKENEDEYNRYRDYFYRRYGTNFID